MYWSRRRFLQCAALTGLASTTFTKNTHAAPRAFIDIHTHFGQQWSHRDPLSPEDLLRWMDTNHIEKAVVLPLLSPEAWDYVITPEYVLEKSKPHRDRLIPFCHIDPRTLYLNGLKPKVDMLKRYVDAGAKGFGEHKPGVAMDDPRNLDVFAACAEVGLPVLFHIDNDRNMDQPGLPGLAKALESFPNLPFIGHANGFWASITGDATQAQFGEYPKGKVTPGGAIDTLMDRFPNLYGDLSAGSGANAILRDMDFGKEFLIRRADRLMFGTDYLMPNQPVPQISLYNEIDLPEDVQQKIFRGNALRVLGMGP